MKEIQVTIEALAPLAIGRQKPGGSITEAQAYIPGAVMRGAVASRLLSQGAEPGEPPSGDFQRLFIDSDAAIFGNAYPTLPGQAAQVLPATAVSSKAQPGFRSEQAANGGVFDTLIDRYCAEGYGHLYDPNCPHGTGRVEPFGGFYSQTGKRYQSHSVATRLLTRVGINRRRATAQEKVLYSIEAINEKQLVTHPQGKTWQPTHFSSTIRLDDAELANLLTQYLNVGAWRVGGSVSRGLGKVALSAQLKDYQSQTAQRLKAFNAQLQQRWRTWQVFGSPQTPLASNLSFFTLDLESDAILVDQWRRTTVISPGLLCQMAKVEDPDLRLHASYSSYDYGSGWNVAWGLMKDVELLTLKGAVYLYSTPHLDQWLPALERLEQRGVGERTSEGLGQVQVCSAFHRIFRESAV